MEFLGPSRMPSEVTNDSNKGTKSGQGGNKFRHVRFGSKKNHNFVINSIALSIDFKLYTMDTYNFIQREKVRCWKRIYFDIEAENLEEARKKAMEFRNKSAGDYEGFIYYGDLLPIDEGELILPSEQDGQATIKLYDDDGYYPFATNSEADDNEKDN